MLWCQPCSNWWTPPIRRALSSKPARCCCGGQIGHTDGQTDRRKDSVPLHRPWAAYYPTVPINVRINGFQFFHCYYAITEDWVKKCMEHEVEGSRPRGRPKKTWKEVVREDCQAHKLNKEDATDRCKWRKMTKEARWSGWVWVGECFFWYRPTRVVPDQRLLNGRLFYCQLTVCFTHLLS